MTVSQGYKPDHERMSDMRVALVRAYTILGEMYDFYLKLAEAGCIDDEGERTEARWELMERVNNMLKTAGWTNHNSDLPTEGRK